jgi:hypothetical protein
MAWQRRSIHTLDGKTRGTCNAVLLRYLHRNRMGDLATLSKSRTKIPILALESYRNTKGIQYDSINFH